MLTVVAEFEFQLEYDGPALESHEMDARDFATAVLNAAELFQVMNADVNPYDPPLTVNIRAVAPASFDIWLKLVTDSSTVLTSTAISSGVNLANLVQIFAGIIRLARQRRHSDIVSTEASPGGVTVSFGDVSIEVPSKSLDLSESYRVRHNINEIVRPIDGSGIETLSIKEQEVIIERIDHTDVESLLRPIRSLVATELEGSEREVLLEIVSPTFKTGNAWRLSDGGTTFMAKVTDTSFLDSIDGGEPFRKGDQIRCILREIQWTSSDGSLKIRREVVEVIDHIPAPFQASFDL